jgi:ATP-dependent DNA helicase RecQ
MALVGGSVGVIRDQWRPEPAPTWVTSVPAAGRGGSGAVGGSGGAVAEFAVAVAAELPLPYVACLTAVADAPPQDAQHNSVLQLENARATLGIRAGVAVPPGPVLLIDDLVDSRWMLTVAGSLLREHGSGPVHPFVLAEARARSG